MTTAMDKLNAMRNGRSVIVSDAELDEIEKADWNIVKRLCTIPNPSRCGILDAYIAKLK